MAKLETILLPGLYGAGELFKPLLQAAPPESKISVVTYPLESGLGFEDLVAIAECQIPDGNPVQLVAESFSGLVAIRLLTRKNRNYKRVVFCATFASPPFPCHERIAKLLPMLVDISPVFRKLAIRRFCFNGLKSLSLTDLANRIICNMPTPVLRERLAIIGSLNLISELRKIIIPSVYLQPSHDRLIPRRCAKEFADHMPSMVTHEINGPHFLLQACPQVSARVIFGEPAETKTPVPT